MVSTWRAMSAVMRLGGNLLADRNYLDIKPDVRGEEVEAGVYGRVASDSAVPSRLPNLPRAPR
jgi:hypothetical protein